MASIQKQFIKSPESLLTAFDHPSCHGDACLATPKIFEFNARTGLPIVRQQIAMCRRMVDLYISAMIDEQNDG